jgi:glycosyltransferase involved in cell wall biosynthesis
MVDVSVIIPSYDCGAYLAESPDSMLARAVTGVEVIVVDDGSTDDTGGLAQHIRFREGDLSAARTAASSAVALRLRNPAYQLMRMRCSLGV